MRGGTYIRFHADGSLSGCYFVSYIHESVSAAASNVGMYVEGVRRLATERGFPVIVTKYTYVEALGRGYGWKYSGPPEVAEYMHDAHTPPLNIRPSLYGIPPLTGYISVPYTADEVNERLDAIPRFRDTVPDDVREHIGQFLNAGIISKSAKPLLVADEVAKNVRIESGPPDRHPRAGSRAL